MAHLSLHNHVNGVAVHHDSGRQTVTLVAWPLSVTFKADEARRLRDELAAALTGLAVKGAEVAEREALTPWQRLPDLPESAYPPDAVPLDPPVAGTGGPW